MTEPRTTTEILRDVDGIAHIRSPSLEGAFEAQGLAAAEDRMWQMELDRLRATGRLAAVVGPSAVGSDAFHRRCGLAAAARRDHDGLAAETRSVLAAYARGVNRYLDGDPDLAPEFGLLHHRPAPWEPWQSIAVFKYRHLAMGTYETKVWRSGLVRQLGRERAARLWPAVDEVTIDPDEDVVRVAAAMADALVGVDTSIDAVGADLGSNNLVVAGSRTRTGRPILAGDPHRAIDLPNVYWQNHVTCPDLDVIGLSFPGVPGFPHFGHNHDVAWCITHGMADDQDVYVETMRPAGGGIEARHEGSWVPAVVGVETIDVVGSDPVTVRCIETTNGPVVAGDEHVGLALRWTALAAPDTTFDSLVPMLRARSVDDLDAAFRPWVVPVNNVLMADRAGAIAYRMRGRLAVRERDNGWTAVPGDAAAHAWSGFVADADLPRWRDPSPGFLVTANNRVTTEGPYITHDWAHPARAARLTDRLRAASDWDVDTVGTLLGDTHSSVAGQFAARVLAVEPSHPLEAAAQAMLRDWEGHMDAGSPPAAVYGGVRAELVRLVSHDLGLVHDRLPGVPGPTLHQTLRFVNARLAFWIDDRSLVTDEAVATALRFATRHLQLTQGADPRAWRWGTAHTAEFVHPLAAFRPDLADALAVPPPVGLGGDNECVWATSVSPPSTRACNGPVARYVFDVGDWDRSRWIVPHGVSGDPGSSHHLDQLDDWAAIRLRPMRFSTAAVDAATTSITVVD